MSHVFTIAARELRSMFSTPVAYVLFAVYMVFAGYIFFVTLQVFQVLPGLVHDVGSIANLM